MAADTYSVTTSSSDLANIWRKVQAGVLKAFQFGVEEWEWMKTLKKFTVDWSAREITAELDIYDDTNTAVIPEGGYEAYPTSPSTATATLTWILMNKRFTVSKTAQYISEQQGTRGQLESQLRWQSKKAVDGIRRKFGDMFYGLSTGVVGVVSAASGDLVTVTGMYAQTGLGAATDNRKATDLFRVGDHICFVQSAGTLRSTSSSVPFQEVTGITTASQYLTCNASECSTLTAGDLIVFANNLEQTSSAGGTEYNKGLVGLIDGVTTASIHGVTSATYPRWAAAVNNSSGGRFTTTKFQNLRDSIYNLGGGEMDMIIWAQGVQRDVVSQLSAGLRFSDAFALELDGKAKARGVMFNTSRRVPDGYVWGLVKSNSVNKMTLLPEPGQQAFGDGYKLQDNSGLVFPIDFPCAMIWTNRGNVGMYSGLTQS
jgi:hypothetical protein